MRTCLAVFALLALVAVAPAAADLIDCTSKKTITIDDDSEVFGCDGYVDSVVVTWQLTAQSTRKLTFTKMDTEPNRDTVTITGAGINKKYSGTAIGAPLLLPPGLITVTFRTDGSVTKTGFSLKLEPGPTITELVSGHEITASEAQPGGFVYFILRGCGRGTDLNVQMHVHEYQGLKPPGLFMNRNIFPTLEQGGSGWSNTSSERQSDGSYVASIKLKVDSSRSSKLDDYLIGVFMYGTSTAVSVSAHWTFSTSLNVPITSGQRIESSTSSSKYYQILNVPTGSGALNIATSREVPGGMFVVLISQGRLPTQEDHDYILDTRISPYQTVTVNNPNPSSNHSPNPGNYLIKVESVGSGTAGFLLMATWDNAKNAEIVELTTVDLPQN